MPLYDAVYNANITATQRLLSNTMLDYCHLGLSPYDSTMSMAIQQTMVANI